jgi:hypothetical protein
MNEFQCPGKKKKTFLEKLDEYSGPAATVTGCKHTLHRSIQIQYDSQFAVYRRPIKEEPDVTSYSVWQDKHETQITPTPLPKQEIRMKQDILVQVQSIEDLLSILDTHAYDSSIDYNIDLKALHSIRTELKQLQSMVGLSSLKTSILRQLMYFIQGFADDPHDGDFKHTVLTGPPGTGKTEIAKILGNMYSKIGILKKNVFRKVTRTDLVAGYLGQTAIKTRKVLDECNGGVLFIDEAYSLHAEDIYAKECLDTLCEGLSDNKNDLMVIIAGYKAELDNTFFRINSGIRSRFIWRFDIEPYGTKDLFLIFVRLATTRNWTIEDAFKPKWFDGNKQHFKDNGRSMEQLFSYSKISHAQRIYGKDISLRKRLTCEDIQDGLSLYREFGNSAKTDNISLSLYS